MPLTNSDKVVTEQRLHEYHETIFPYLGGMPDILANKFSRADLYSTDEKMIGRWIDGKPLYQKVIIHNPTITVPTIGSNGATIATIANIETLVDAWCLSNYFNTRTRVTNFEKEGNNIIANASMYSVEINKSIIQYTKTTDSSVEIGSDTDYSTTEKIVGTWIDGKPIYQKTIDCGALPNNTLKIVAHGINNLNHVINYSGWCYDSTGLDGPVVFVSPSSIAAQVSLYSDKINLHIGSGNDLSDFSCYVTLQYTKTTDTTL